MKNVSPLQDLNRAKTVLDSCLTEPQLDTAYNYFQLVIQKYEHMLTIQSKHALQSEFEVEYFSKKSQMKLD